MRRLVPATATLLLVGLIFWCQADGSLGAEGPIQREFWLSTDPAVEVLTVTYTGGMTNLVTKHRVFADGRFLLQFISSVDGEVKRQHELRLSDEELTALVAIAVEGGLMEHNQKPYQEKLRLYRSSDGGNMTVDINLDRYRGPSQREWGPASRSVSVSEITAARRHFPKVEAFEALEDLARKVNEYRHLAEEKGE